MIQRFIDNDPIGILTLLGSRKANPDAKLFIDDPDNPTYLYLSKEGFCSFSALNEDAVDRLIPELQKSNLQFSGVRHKWANKIVAARGAVWHEPCHLLYYPKTECEIEILHPVRSLRPEGAALINEHWKYGEGNAEDHIRERIEKGPTTACDDEEGMVAWNLTHSDGSMGFIHTMERARRKGYAQSVAGALIRKILDLDETPFCYVVKGNEASLDFSAHIGLVHDGESDYLEIKAVE